jgi:hypothetical protein
MTEMRPTRLFAEMSSSARGSETGFLASPFVSISLSAVKFQSLSICSDLEQQSCTRPQQINFAHVPPRVAGPYGFSSRDPHGTVTDCNSIDTKFYEASYCSM